MDNLTYRLITKIASSENFFKINLLPVWAHRLPIRNTIQLQHQQLHTTHSKAYWNIFSHPNRSYQTEIDNTKMFLELIPLSTKLGLLEMLDLEDCEQLKDRHLKNICNHVFQLKYLSLRNTNITKLPKHLNKLKYQLLTFEIQRYELFPGRPFYFQS